jgi:hypothetical protein
MEIWKENKKNKNLINDWFVYIRQEFSFHFRFYSDDYSKSIFVHWKRVWWVQNK